MAVMLGNHLTFIGSFQFMSSCLDKLVSNLSKEAFKYTSEEFTGKELSLMSQKGVFNIKTISEYHDLYLKSDVLLLADAFESFRKTYLQYYKLNPCHYFTSPGLSWDAMLKMTDIKLELMIDVDMFQFI